MVHHVGCYRNDFDYFGIDQVAFAGRTNHFPGGRRLLSFCKTAASLAAFALAAASCADF